MSNKAENTTSKEVNETSSGKTKSLTGNYSEKISLIQLLRVCYYHKLLKYIRHIFHDPLERNAQRSFPLFSSFFSEQHTLFTIMKGAWRFHVHQSGQIQQQQQQLL